MNPAALFRPRKSLGWTLLLICVLMQVTTPALAENAEEARRKRLQMEQMIQEKTQIQEKLAYFKNAQRDLQEEVERLREMVTLSRKRRFGLEERVASITKDKEIQEKLLARRQGQMKASKARINSRLRRMYRLTKQSQAAQVFQTIRFLGYARDAHLLSLLQAQDRKALDEFQTLAEDVQKKSRALADTLNQLGALREELTQEEAHLAEREAFLKASIQDQARNQTLYRKYLVDLEQMIEGMDTEIRKLEESSEKALVEKPENAAPPAPGGGMQGTLPLPAEGRLIAGFGEQDPRYDLKKFQRGIVLRVKDQAPVRAVAPGTVVHAGPFRGYQNLVVLDNGGSLFTVYGHLEDLRVERGQIIKQGTPLGKATLAAEDGFDVYFEIRYQGTPEDPAKWLKPDILKR